MSDPTLPSSEKPPEPADASVPGSAVPSAGGAPAVAEAAPVAVADEPAPPPGRLVLQLVVFPLALVVVFAAIFLFFGLAAGSDKDFRQYLQEIRNGGVNQRWQAAYQLAMRLQEVEARDEKGFFGPEDVAETVAIFKAAKHDDPRTRQYMASILGRLRDPLVLPALVEVVKDEKEAPETRFSAIFAIGMLGEKARGEVPLLALEMRRDDPTIRAVSAYVLGYIGDPSVLGDLRERLDDDDKNVRWNAALALARMGDDTGLGIIETLLSWEPPEQPAGLGWNSMFSDVQSVREGHRRELVTGALAAIGHLKAQRLRDTIAKMAETDRDTLVRDAARHTLDVLDGKADAAAASAPAGS